MHNGHTCKHDAGQSGATPSTHADNAVAESHSCQNSTRYIIAEINCNGVVLIPDGDEKWRKSDYERDYLLGQTIVVGGILILFAFAFLAIVVAKYT